MKLTEIKYLELPAIQVRQRLWRCKPQWSVCSLLKPKHTNKDQIIQFRKIWEDQIVQCTLTGGVEAALITKEVFLTETAGFVPNICLAVWTEEVSEEETSACAAIFRSLP